MAIYEVLLNQIYFGQRTINRFNYISSGTEGTALPAFALVSAMGFDPADIVAGAFPAGSLAESIRGMQSSAVIYSSVFCRNLYSDTDFYEAIYPSGVNGLSVGEAMSPAIAYGFVSNRANLGIRRSTRRIVGVVETVVGAGGVLTSGGQDVVDAAAEKFSEVLSYTDEGASLSFSPATLAREEYTTPSGKRAYRKYPTESEQLDNSVSGIVWGAYLQVRTQTSRQYGRGV